MAKSTEVAERAWSAVQSRGLESLSWPRRPTLRPPVDIFEDAEGVTLGRLASQVAKIIVGKHKPMYTPHVDCGDYVVVINAQKIRVTGNKMTEKMYQRHSLYDSGFKESNLRDVLAKKPERVIKEAVWGMIPHSRLGRQQIKKLKV